MNLLVTHILRGAQLLLALLVLGLAAESCHSFSFYGNVYPPQSAFLVFCAVWTLLAVLYFQLAPRFAAAAAHPIARTVVDALTCLFWFAGFIALAVLVGAIGSVYVGIDGYQNTSHWYAVSAAATAFGAFEWVLFVVTTVFTVLELVKGGSHSTRHKTEQNPEVGVI